MNDDKKELLWRQYALHVDLYKFYMNVVIKINIFYYAITGGLLSYYFSNQDNPLLKWSLILPIIMSFALSFIFLYGSGLIKITRQELFNIRDRLNLETAPEIAILSITLKAFGIIFLLISLALLIYILC
jgi:hypothetical protein